MKFTELLSIVGDEPVFSSALLRVGDVDPVDVASQLSRWVASGRLVALRRGVYALADAYRKRDPHPFETANRLVEPSYVSLESALAFHGLIPEAVFETTNVTTARSGIFHTQFGRFSYRHIAPGMMWGYESVKVGAAPRAVALIARPEKALLDLAYLRPRADSEAFVRELRLERTATLDLATLSAFAQRTGKPKLERAARMIIRLSEEDSGVRET